MTREYIGARYIPRFKGTFDPSLEYEAMDVVNNGAGTSYISKKPVPAGTSLTDTEYWFLYGSATGAELQLQEDVATLFSDLAATDARVDGLTRKLLVIGNSYANRGCADDLKKTFKEAYQKNVGGNGFVDYTAHSTNFADQLQDAINDPDIPTDEITDVLFLSAMGDTRAWVELGISAYENSLRTSLNRIKNMILSDMPLVDKISISFGESRAIYTFSDNNYVAPFRIHHTFNRIAPDYGIRYIGWSGYNNMFHANCFEADNFHPNVLGAQRISTWVLNSYYGTAAYDALKLNERISCSYAAGSTVGVEFQMTPDHVDLNIKNIKATSGSTITLVDNQPLFSSVDLSIPFVRPTNYSRLAYDCFVHAAGSAAQIDGAMRIRVSNDAEGCANILVETHSTGTAPGADMFLVGGSNISYDIE